MTRTTEFCYPERECAPGSGRHKGGKGMHAVVGVWDMGAGGWEEQQRALREEIVPIVRGMLGFVAGYWMADRAAAKTHATIVWADERSARRFEESIWGAAGQGSRDEAGVGGESTAVFEVLAATHR